MIKLYYSHRKHNNEAFIKESLRRFTGKRDFVIRRSENGKPYINGNSVFFSLSHTDGLIICAVSDKEVGADAEKIRTVKNKEKILSRYTGERVENIGDTEFFRAWTAFESRVKYFGEKLAVCPRAKSIPMNITTTSFDGYIVSICSDSRDEVIRTCLK